MFFFIVGLIFFIFKFYRLIFILISLEFMMMGCFFIFCFNLSGMLMFFFLSLSVLSSVLGMILIIFLIKNFGEDKIIFCSYKLI